jgi:surfactin synthase thioesterase subunit
MAIARVQLICLPYAGAGAAVYRGWQSRLPHWIELIALELPGHGLRQGEPVVQDWRELIDIMMASVRARVRGPLALFGHSMGALVAIELAHALRASGGPTPLWVGAAGCVAPQRRELDLTWLDCPDERLIAELRSLGGTPGEVLECRDLLDLILPTVRADFHLCGSYQPARRAPLDCPMLVLGGVRDPISRPYDNLSAWSLETNGPCRIELVDGGHFFIHEREASVVGVVISSVAESVRRSEPAHVS